MKSNSNSLQLANPTTSVKVASPRYILSEDTADQQPPTAFTGARRGASDQDKYPRHGTDLDNHVDFIGPSKAVKHLFSLPYNSDRNTSVALHNIGNGTLLLDSGDDFGGDGQGTAANFGNTLGAIHHESGEQSSESSHGRARRRRQRPSSWSIEDGPRHGMEEENELNQAQIAQLREGERSLLASLSLLLEEEKQQQQSQHLQHVAVSDEEEEDGQNTVEVVPDKESPKTNPETALVVPLNALVLSNDKPMISAHSSGNTSPVVHNSNIDPNIDNPLASKLLPPEHYLSHVVAPPSEPRQYVDWQFQDMTVRVGSDLVIYKQQHNSEVGNIAENSAMAIHAVDAAEMKSQMKYFNRKRQEFTSSRHPALPPSSYAEALKLTPSSSEQVRACQKEDEKISHAVENINLQTCIIPAELAQLGFTATAFPPTTTADSTEGISANTNTVSVDGNTGGTENEFSSASPPPSPLCTVLDTYLDNLMANVPQLALLLREQGFVQNIKLLRTEDIPSLMMHPSILGGEAPSSPVPPAFDPDIVEMNASMLLRFLKTHCTRENSTYLLRRAANTTELQLFDVSGISELGVQRKWVWWLALCSYRFACRLEQLQLAPQIDGATRREYRARQRSLLHNTLDLFEKLVDIDSTNASDGGRHETIKAAVFEHLADTYLWTDGEAENGDDCTEILGKPVEEKSRRDDTNTKATPTLTPCASSSQPYRNVTVDCLGKAHDHLINGIQQLTSPLSKAKKDKSLMEVEAISTQLYGIHHKIVNVCLRLADHHVKNYYSSNLIQSLRTAARMLSDTTSLLQHLDITPETSSEFKRSILSQYALLWEYCGHFARTFASDNLWRDRGHTCGTDLIGLLCEVNVSCGTIQQFFGKALALAGSDKGKFKSTTVTASSHRQVSLNSLSGIVILPHDFEQIEASVLQKEGCRDAIQVSKLILDQKTQIKREARQALVAACFCYGHVLESHAILDDHCNTKEDAVDIVKRDWKDSTAGLNIISIERDTKAVSVPLIRQRLGDACNEIGKILLSEARAVLLPHFSPPRDKVGMAGDNSFDMSHVSAIMLASAQFWFMEGLARFTECNDLRNLALLRCNLCQCSKIRANTNVVLPGSKPKNNSETYLQDAVDHLVSAHGALGERDVDPLCWDMVSEELAATLLVLGVRRRQSALSSSSPEPLMIQASRLTPGVENAIIEPMERSCKIYELLGTVHAAHQAAAAHYQLALYFSKVWTCQRDEVKTRDKLAAAFKHYILAQQYFSRHIENNQTTFVVLSLDFSNLYSAVNGKEECLLKALTCCLDTRKAFTSVPLACKATLEKMTMLSESVELRVSKLLLSLVKIKKEKYKRSYRRVLEHKMSSSQKEGTSENETITFPIVKLLQALSKDLFSV